MIKVIYLRHLAPFLANLCIASRQLAKHVEKQGNLGIPLPSGAM
jgi:hypothetical protein